MNPELVTVRCMLCGKVISNFEKHFCAFKFYIKECPKTTFPLR